MKILFLGDSITDVGKKQGAGSLVSIGQGYAMLIAVRLGMECPQKYTFVNNGISGDRVVDLYARLKKDVWNEEPDVLSILVGINDVWHEFVEKNGVEADRFETVLRMLVRDTQKRLPGIRILLLEPFVFIGEDRDGHAEEFRHEVLLRAEAVRRVAEECGCTFVPLQKKFEEAYALAPASYWIGDGVHPTPAGHGLIAREWLAAFGETEPC